jgi:hypothetical protein
MLARVDPTLDRSVMRSDGTGGCEDPRLTFFEPHQKYVMTYTAHSSRVRGSPWRWRGDRAKACRRCQQLRRDVGIDRAHFDPRFRWRFRLPPLRLQPVRQPRVWPYRYPLFNPDFVLVIRRRRSGRVSMKKMTIEPKTIADPLALRGEMRKAFSLITGEVEARDSLASQSASSSSLSIILQWDYAFRRMTSRFRRRPWLYVEYSSPPWRDCGCCGCLLVPFLILLLLLLHCLEWFVRKF